ncbi:hypothetical protein ACFS5L_28015 [Streptomyces phyllanthi]|uniref:Uncharacterized protein n=1 Tax=Streptomyces phyllanthi TaxID=1803180 RepID=A0A5N8W0N7_9ACTN|nr:hypothetical protein [Streptomyces phyllanthi]MPY39725.1 hypothetical protein [Streptomyces phyllanthi]
MGWTHDYSDVARNRRSTAGLNSHQRGTPQVPGTEDPRLGIPRILRRRARWVSARLRHPRA